MSKATILADLYKKAVQEYTKTPGEWMGLLSCVAKFYKRSFDNAVLIYAQKPDATQLATFDEWHDKRIDRSINRGAKGIAVIDMANPNASIKYLFDFMDTNGSERSLKNLFGFMWELEEQYRPSLLIKFHEKYTTPTSGIEACLYKLVSKKVADILPKYMENFKIHDESSMLYGLPIKAVKAEFAQLVTDSVAYTVFSKCGISTEIFNENAFERISHFNSLDLFMALGSCTVSFARLILKEIHQEIQNIKIERSKTYENRTSNAPELQAGRGQDDVPRPPNLAEPGHGQRPGGQIRESVEELHDREPSPPPVGAGGAGQNQRGNLTGRRGSGNPQGNADTAATHHPADAGYRGYDGESHPHDNADTDSRGNRDERTGDESQVAPTQATQPLTDGKKPSVGGFFVIPLKTPTPVPVEAAAAESMEQNDSFSYQLSLEPDTAASAEPEAEALETEILPASVLHDLSNEEISDLMDVVLCADDYRYSPDHHLYDGGPKTKCQNNIAAIRLLRELQAQGRPAMADEQIILAKFVGWGGLANALTPGKSGWEQQYEEIKSLLTDEEFQAAQESTLTAYYTEQSIISHIYKGLEGFGFRGGNRSALNMGSYADFPVSLFRTFGSGVNIVLSGQCRYTTELGEAALGNITRLENLAERIKKAKEEKEHVLLSLNQQFSAAKAESEKPFPNAERLTELQKRKVELDLALEFKDDGEDVLGVDDEYAADSPDSPKTPLTLEQRLYQKLAVFAAPILNGGACCMKLKSDGFEDLVLEAIGGGEYSIAHYYEQNGDAMRDPEITFSIDQEMKAIHPTSFLQDSMGIFYETDGAAPAKVKDLKEFMCKWFTNIKNQGFDPVRVKSCETETEDETELER